MAVTSRAEPVTVAGGERMDALAVVPASGAAPGLLLLQEIFGVNDYIRGRAAALASLGYAVLCPDVFWRLERNVELGHDDAGLGAAFGYAQRLDVSLAVADLGAALEHLRGLPEVRAAGGRVGTIGFCLGGTLSWEVARRFGPRCAVAYYGSGVKPVSADEVPPCPVLLQYGEDDPYIPAEQVDGVRAAIAGRPDVELHLHPGAGHAFDNDHAGRFHHPAARAAAWTLSIDFLRRTLPVEAGSRYQ